MSSRPGPGGLAWQLRDLAAGFLGVIGRPSRGFYRLAEEGGTLWPPVIAGLVGLVASGAEPLKAVIIAAVGGRPDCYQLYVAAFVVLFPFYYAGSAAGFALGGWLLGGRRTGLGWRQLFRRVWRVLGWVNLPLFLVSAGFLAYLLTRARSLLAAIAAGVVPGTVPSLTFSVTGLGLVFSAAAVWVVLLFVVGLRQALAGSTGRTVAVIVTAGLLFSVLVHTPVARGVLTSFPDTYRALGQGRPTGVSVSLQAYRLPSRRLPGLGDLVAYSRAGGGRGITSGLSTPVGEFFQSGTPRLAYLGRVMGLPGDVMAVRGGVVFRNGRPAPEGHRPGLTGGQIHPAGLDLPETRVGPGEVFILPDDRSVLPDLPEEAGPLVAAGRIIGRIVSVGQTYVLPAAGFDADSSGSGPALGARAAEVAVVSRGDARVFALYAGLNRAGYDEEFGQAMHPVRVAVRKALAGAEPAWVQAFRDLAGRAGPGRLQRVLVEEVGPPPGFAPAKGSGAAYGPAHAEEAARLEAPARDAVLATLAYCREDWSRAREVVVIPNLLASAKTASLWLSETGGTAFVFAGPADGLPLKAVAHEFCHLVVGPVMLEQAAARRLERFDPILDRSLAAGTVASKSYRELRSYVEDCLVRALVIRIRPDGQVEERLQREAAWGFHLVRPFWQALGPYEDTGGKLTEQLPGILDAVDVDAVLREVATDLP